MLTVACLGSPAAARAAREAFEDCVCSRARFVDVPVLPAMAEGNGHFSMDSRVRTSRSNSCSPTRPTPAPPSQHPACRASPQSQSQSPSRSRPPLAALSENALPSAPTRLPTHEHLTSLSRWSRCSGTAVDAVVVVLDADADDPSRVFALCEALKKNRDRVFLCVASGVDAALRRAATSPALQAVLLFFLDGKTLWLERAREGLKTLLASRRSWGASAPFDLDVLASADYCRGADARSAAKMCVLLEMHGDHAQRKKLESKFVQVLASANSDRYRVSTALRAGEVPRMVDVCVPCVPATGITH